jgi:hypothetical protein
MVFNRGSSSRRDCATTERGSASVGVCGSASLPPYFVPLLVDGLEIRVVLQRKVLAPDRGVDGFVGELDDAEERIAGFLLALEDVHEQRRDRGGPTAVETMRAMSVLRFMSYSTGGLETAPSSMCPTELWQRMQERSRSPGVYRSSHRLHDVFVTAKAVSLGDLAVARKNPDRLVERSGREIERVPEAVADLRRVLSDEIVRCVAVVAHGDRTMAALYPAVELFAHDVAVRARAGIVREIGVAPCIDEGVARETHERAEDDGGYDRTDMQPRTRRR